MSVYKYLKNPPESTWVNWKTGPSENHIGFVYEIIDKETKKSYIGIKRFWGKYTLPPLKGKKNKRHFLKETDWRTYNSSGNFQELIKNNPNRFNKVIIKECKTITEMKCYEAYFQLKHYVYGDWDSLYNEMINLRLRIPKSK